ncbi:MAG: D-glycerate dehydrogenase [Gemmatimonadaceae bacterium]
MTTPRTVFVTRRLPDAVESVLASEYGAVLRTDDRQLDDDELIDALSRVDVVLCTLSDRLSRRVLLAAPPKAGLLANFGAGVDHIDLAAAREAGIAVSNTPGVLTEDTADLTMLLILAAARRAGEGTRELREQTWEGWRPTHLLGTRVHGATLGIVGFGRIGRAVARRAHGGFGMRIAYHSRHRAARDEEQRVDARYCDDLDELLRTCDVVTLHTPATPATHHLIGPAQLQLMPRHAFLINTSRGDVVDQQALIAALATGRIAGAGLDVFEKEPAVAPELLAIPSVFALPHLGSATIPSRVAMGECAVRNIAAFVAGQPLPNRVA